MKKVAVENRVIRGSHEFFENRRGCGNSLHLFFGALLLFIAFQIFLSPACLAEIRIEPADDQRYLTYLMEILDRAEKSVDVVSLTFHAQKPLVAMIQQRLVNLADKGVKVRLFMEGSVSWARRENEKTGLQLDPHPNIETRLGHPGRIVHTKLFVVDSQLVLVGSTNMSDNSMLNNHEANVIIDSAEAGKAFTRYFDMLWQDDGRDCNVSEILDNGRLRIITDRAYFQEVSKILQKASKSIYIAKYILAWEPDKKEEPVNQLFDALVQAKKRGVDLRFLVEDKAASKSAIATNIKTEGLLVAAGMNRIWHDQAEAFMHSKLILVDEETLILSSFNWNHDIGSNHNAGVIIRDPALINYYKDYLARLTTKPWLAPEPGPSEAN